MSEALVVPTQVAPFVQQEPTVDARELHATLGVGRDFTNWIKDQIERFELVADQDYHLAKSGEMVERAQGGGLSRDVYTLTLSAAELIAVSMRTPEAQRARAALLSLKNKWNDPAAVMARALQMAAAMTDRLQEENARSLAIIAQLEPKAKTFDTLMGTDEVFSMAKAANILSINHKIGRNRLFRTLRNRRILKGDNSPYQEHIDAKRFRVAETLWTDPHGKDHARAQTFVTSRGMDFLRRLLDGEMEVH